MSEQSQNIKFANVQVRIIENGEIHVISINRAKLRNCIDQTTAVELAQAFMQFEKDPTSLVAVFASSQGMFCAGYDLREAASLSVQSLNEDNASLFDRFDSWEKPKKQVNGIQDLAPLGVSRMQLSKPIIGAIEGFAVAGGLELACWCDILVSHNEAIFGVYCRRFGVPLIDGGTIRLAKIIGYNRAKDMLLTGRPVQGSEAYAFGLVNYIVPQKEVESKAIDIAKLICSFPQKCMKSDRRSLFESTFPMLERDLLNEYRLGIGIIQSGESGKGATSFVNGQHNIKPKL